MKDTVYLSYGPGGVTNMTKTTPRKNTQYVKVTVEVPDPPEVHVTLPVASPTVEATNVVQPDWVDDLVWCNVHGTVHDAVDGGPMDPFGDDTPCNDFNWQRIAREPETTGAPA